MEVLEDTSFGPDSLAAACLATSPDEEEEVCEDNCCDEDDPVLPPSLPASRPTTANAMSTASPAANLADSAMKVLASLDAADAAAAESTSEGDVSASASTEITATETNKKAKRSQSVGARLENLAKPRVHTEPPPPEVPKIVKKEKKKPNLRPSVLLRLRPLNLDEAWQAFEASGFTEPPRFQYAHSEESVTKTFEENSNICFAMLPDARRILNRVHQDYGGPDAFMERLYGGNVTISAEEMKETVAAYLRDHNIGDKAEIRIVDGMLAAANVTKTSDGHVVNISSNPIAQAIVPGLCDHEVGTHLLRMMNDEHQAWHGIREKYKMTNPWTTEEGFATLNTFQTMPCKLLYAQALRYFAVCRSAEVGFVELFQELQTHISCPKKCWQMCCRAKRGMIDTSKPGAFYIDQAYFKGAVEILRHLEEIDLPRLYGGQIALQDLDKVHFMVRKEVVRLPKFLNSAKKLEAYKSYCRKLIKENQIEVATERVCKQVFIRTAKTFFQEKPKGTEVRASSVNLGCKDLSRTTSRALDLARLEDLARPRPRVQLESNEAKEDAQPSRAFDPSRLLELDLAKPRQSTLVELQVQQPHEKREVDHKRLVALSMPRPVKDEDEESPAAPSPSKRPPRRRRLASVPAGEGRPQSQDAEPPADVPPPPEPTVKPCRCRPKRKSKCRIVQMARERRDSKDQEDSAPEAGAGDEAEQDHEGLEALSEASAEQGSAQWRTSSSQPVEAAIADSFDRIAEETRRTAEFLSAAPMPPIADVQPAAPQFSTHPPLLGGRSESQPLLHQPECKRECDAQVSTGPRGLPEQGHGRPGLASQGAATCSRSLGAASRRGKLILQSLPHVRLDKRDNFSNGASSWAPRPVRLPHSMKLAGKDAANGELWKAVPIKTMDLQLGL